MGKGKTLNSKAKRLLDLHGYNQKQFAQISDTTYSAVHDFFNSDRNVTIKLFQKIMTPLGVNLEEVLEERINTLLGKTPVKNQETEDIARLISSLDKIQRKTLLKTAINFYKLNEGRTDELIERIEKRQL